MIRKKIFEISGSTDTNNDSSKKTKVESETNKVSTNKRCQFLENILPINGTSEQNSNGYCNVDFFIYVGLNKCFLYLWHQGNFQYHEFIFIFKMYNFRPHIS